MEYRYCYPNPQLGPDPFTKEGQALIKSGLWMRVGFVGASAVAIGAIAFVTGDMQPLAALATLVAGGVLAAFAWRRSWLQLDRIDRDDEVAAPAIERGGGTKPRFAAQAPRMFAADWAAG